MGKVLVEATIENVGDLIDVERGQKSLAEVRSVIVPDALVDTGAWGVSMPRSLLKKLGLKQLRVRNVMTAAGKRKVRVFGTARLTIMGRDYPTDVSELPDGCPVLIGQLPLEAMDYVVDMRTHKVIGNPAHGGEQILDLYSQWKV
jgi:clan AA aspartic protease